MEERRYNEAVAMLKARIERMKERITAEKETLETSQNGKENESQRETPAIPDEEPDVPEEELAEGNGDLAPPTIPTFSTKKAQLKNHILHSLRTGQQSTASLKRHIVDKRKLCSKASFYRYISELKQEQHITILKIEHDEYCVLIEK